MMVAAAASTTVQLQAIGVVVLVDRDLRIRHISRNAREILDRDAEAMIGQHLSALLASDDVAWLSASFALGDEAVDRRHVTVAEGTLKVRTFDPGGELLGLDLLPLPDDHGGSAAAAIERVASWNEQLLEATSVDALIESATRIVGERTGFDGSWICRTEDDAGTATVVSAWVPGGTPTALGTSVQPSDMPPHQIMLRGRSLPYFVADLAALPTELVPRADHEELAASSLLLPFPDWLRWLATVGPRSTLGIPIIVGGHLWGWFLAHHPSPRRVPAALQAELQLLGAATGMRMAELQALQETRGRLKHSRASVRVLQAVASADDLIESLISTGSAIPGICEADSAVLSIGGRQQVVGAPLGREVVDQVLAVGREHLTAAATQPVVSGRTLGAAPPVDPDQAAGFAAMRLGPDAQHIVVWVRGEQRRAVRWVQHEVVGVAEQDELFAGLSERVEEERGRCAPWTPPQLREIADIREALTEVFVSRYGAMQTLTAELARSNEEYDAFARAAAHDLKAPLRGIRQNVEFYLEDSATADADPDPAMLRSALRLTDRMQSMLDDLMAYAQVGQASWTSEPIQLSAAVDDAVELLGPRLDGATVVAEPGVFSADPVALRQLLLNLIGNAAKYAAGPAQVTIRRTTLAEAAQTAPVPPTLADAPSGTAVLAVSDRGIGIDPVHHERIFELFRQLDPTAPGGGAGLALCRLICRRSGGDIWLTSELGRGTTFYVAAGA